MAAVKTSEELKDSGLLRFNGQLFGESLRLGATYRLHLQGQLCLLLASYLFLGWLLQP